MCSPSRGRGLCLGGMQPMPGDGSQAGRLGDAGPPSTPLGTGSGRVSATTRRPTGSRSPQLLKVPVWLRRGLGDFPFVGRVWTFTDVDREEAPRCQCHRTLAPTGSCGEEGPPGHSLLSAHRPLPGRLPPNQAWKAWCQLGGSRSRASGWA